jgi:hypothetical protein
LSTWPSVVEIGGDRRHHRDPACVEQVQDSGRVDPHDVADEAEVELLAVDDAPRARTEQPGVLTREADGERAVLVEQADELAPHLAGEHHPHDVHDLGRRHPQPALELARKAEAVEHRP